MTSNPKIRVAILRDLAHVPENYLQPDDVLVIAAKRATNPFASLEEVENALTDLERAGLIICDRNELSGERKWCISPEGRAAYKTIKS